MNTYLGKKLEMIRATPRAGKEHQHADIMQLLKLMSSIADMQIELAALQKRLIDNKIVPWVLVAGSSRVYKCTEHGAIFVLGELGETCCWSCINDYTTKLLQETVKNDQVPHDRPGEDREGH